MEERMKKMEWSGRSRRAGEGNSQVLEISGNCVMCCGVCVLLVAQLILSRSM